MGSVDGLESLIGEVKIRVRTKAALPFTCAKSLHSSGALSSHVGSSTIFKSSSRVAHIHALLSLVYR